ncbi:uncharacterized protein EDB91DRAFT_1253353 [Suillus paluster]|uniref:uncharacterized protein n=1 Tax=Suillus paluster TaxID=48578 RepID=UPI001B860BC6|nr:uncharacterized protein EDB91DRAFT_1253353 [Suillus paluster]KAG1728755.1 hypothetical protein EDB91DRAFT_1253353 [Suillus paluster]
MNVFPMVVKEQTFSLSKLVTVVELLRNQLFLTHAHAEAGVDLPDYVEEVLAVGYCPGCVLCSHRQICYVCRTQIPPAVSLSNSPDLPEGGDEAQSVTDTSSLTSVATTGNVAPPAAAGVAATNAAPPPVTIAATNTAPPPVTIAAATSLTTTAPHHGSTSASACWYIITVGCETGVFQGWHNVHSHVVGVPGACFGQYTSRASADEAYAQVLQDGTVQELPL